MIIMKIDSNNKNYIPLNGQTPKTKKTEEDQSATQFEMLFARQLVSQMTRGLFKMDNKNSLMGNSDSLYRYYITDTLASELAKNHKLGIANMLIKHWNKSINNNAKKPEDP